LETESVSIVIPFLDESESLPALMAALETCFGAERRFRVEVVLVDDGSTDDSVDRLRGAPAPSFPVRLVRLARNYGSHAALRAGLQFARGRWVTFLYADLQDPPELVGRLWERAEQGYDVVWAHRRTREGKLLERGLSGVYAWLMRRFVTPRFPDDNSDIVLFSGDVARNLNAAVESHSSLFLQILTLGFRQTAIEYDRRIRRAGRSKWTLTKKLKLFADSFLAFSFAPVRFVSFAGILLSALGLTWAAYLGLRSLFLGDLSPGWPSLVAFLMVGFGLTNISLGIVAEYLWRTLEAARRRPVFIVRDTLKLGADAEAEKPR
jgi:dolichol-phosphate mannosyltransferase